MNMTYAFANVSVIPKPLEVSKVKIKFEYVWLSQNFFIVCNIKFIGTDDPVKLIDEFITQ